MNAELRHPDVDIDRYLANRLDPADLDAFERHLIGCADCQETLRLGLLVRDELRVAPRTASRRRAPRVLVVGALAAAMIIGLLGWNRVQSRAGLARLGATSGVPAYEGIPVRAGADSGAAEFVAAMRLYGAGRLSEAKLLLRAARARGAPQAASSFFIGALELEAGESERAIAELSTVIAGGQSVYAPESRFYLAKAWLRVGRADSALAHLAAIPDIGTPNSVAARALADSVLEILRR